MADFVLWCDKFKRNQDKTRAEVILKKMPLTEDDKNKKFLWVKIKKN